jgi:hypothetical protein
VPLLPWAIALIDVEEAVPVPGNVAGDQWGLAMDDELALGFVAPGGKSLPMFRRSV